MTDKLTTESSISVMNDTEHVSRNNASFTGIFSCICIFQYYYTNVSIKDE